MRAFCMLLLGALLSACNPEPLNQNPNIQRFQVTPTWGVAPLQAAFNWSVQDPDGDPLICRLDLGNDGSFEYTLNNCTSASTQAHTFGSAGTYPVRLQVEDNRGGSAQQTTSVSVAQPAPANRNPTLTQFIPTPNNGPAPLSVSFGWQISDPDSDALTCRLDVNNDGTPEYTIGNCTSASTQPHSYSAGSYTARLTVDDGRGGSATQTAAVTATNPGGGGPDLRISRVEWGQSVFKENLKLVDGKQALLRVHVLADRTGLSTTLRAQVFRGGAYQGDLTISGPASVPTSENPADLSQSYRGMVPANWVGTGLEVRLQADPDNALSESDESNNSRVLTPAIMTLGNVLPITSVPVRYTDTGAANTVRTPNIPDYAGFLVDLFPLRQVQTQTRATPYNFSGNLRNSADWSRLLSELRTLRQTDSSSRYYYGFVQTGYSSGIIGIGYIGLPVSAGWDANSNNNLANDSSAWVVAHEVGHNFARYHAPCGATSGLDSSYPYANATLGTWGYSLVRSLLLAPGSYRDVMSYCDPQWISDYNYEAIQRYLEQNPPSATSVLSQLSQTVLLIGGKIRGSLVTLEPILRLQAAPSSPEAGPYRLRLQTSSGPREIPFDTYKVASPHGPGVAPGAGDPEEHFSLLLPDPGDLQLLEVLRGGSPILRRDLSLTRMSTDDPAIRLSELGGSLTLTWVPSVFPYASVAHLGQGRTTLAFSLTGGEARLPTQGLPPSGRWEVALSDGFNTRRFEFVR